MIDLNKIVRENIRVLSPYSSARDEFSGCEEIFLDANENPYGTLNRYPDTHQSQLKEIVGKNKGINPNNIFVGNGSDEVIDLLFRIFCNPGRDKVLTFNPTYGMYRVVAEINGVDVVGLDLNSTFEIDINSLKPYLNDERVKIIFLCSPNNPTGNSIHPDIIKYIVSGFEGIVVIDEAYIDFSQRESYTKLIRKNRNLVVLQTLSKAWGLAGARIGFAFASSDIIALLTKVKMPYNISSLNQSAAVKALSNKGQYQENLQLILQEKSRLHEQLESLKDVIKVYPSDANFFLIQFEDAYTTYRRLVEQKIIVRNRDQLIKNCLRITIGTAAQNDALVDTLKLIS